MSDATETPTARDDARPALICVDEGDRRAAVTAALQQLGYDAETPKDAAEAVDRLRKVPYQVVVVDETYAGGSALDNAVLKALNTMAMSVRRYMFVALLGADVKTLDNGTAFARSVNAVVNVSDVGQLATLLRRAVADNDAFYRVFREVLQAAGKR
jgi:CheY-like chemotaxis protein